VQITNGIESIFGGSAFFTGTSYTEIPGARKSAKKKRITSTDIIER
jgi:hypothetical protein